MNVLRYITFENKLTDEVKTITIPTHILDKNIATISPLFASSGYLFKNVSIIEDNWGNQFKVVGNYKYHIDNLSINQKNKIGYK